MDFLHSRQQFEIADVEVNPGPDGTQNGHSRAGRPVDFESEFYQVLDDLLYERLVGAFLHGNNHKKQLLALSF
jgi:hypothetical protein